MAAVAVPSLVVSPAERAAGTLSEAHIVFAVRALNTAGVVAIRGAADPSHTRSLCEKMRTDMASYAAAGHTLHHHWQGLPPPAMHPYLFEDIVFNPFAIAIAQRVCGHPADGSLALGTYQGY
jgi:hypothetical protein